MVIPPRPVSSLIMINRKSVGTHYALADDSPDKINDLDYGSEEDAKARRSYSGEEEKREQAGELPRDCLMQFAA